MRTLKTIIMAGLFAALAASAATAQNQAASFRAENAIVHSAPGGQALTLPSQASAPSVVADFLRNEGASEDTIGSLVLETESPAAATGLTHLRFAQQVDGLTVFGAYVKATVNGDGQLVHLIEALATPGTVRPAIADAREALDAAMAQNHPGVDVTLSQGGTAGNTVTFSGDDFFHRDPTVTRIAIAMNDGALQEGYLVETWSEDGNLLHHTLVGANGRVLDVELRTNNDSYNVFPVQPGVTGQTVVYGPPVGDLQSPDGWLFSGNHTTVNISGNNAHAYLDTDNNNAPDGGGTTVSTGNFLTSADFTTAPTTSQNRNVAVQNLFYLNNRIHDELYRHGFDEGAGNFQEDNFGKGGAGSDSVNAEAQDGGGTNNANFSTPSDGSNPRMQMYIWTQSSPNRDGDVDSDIVWHEYGHGLTWRMIGGMSGPMSGAIGEGMSDVLSVIMNDDDVVGEYSYNRTNGIRSAPYTNYPRTYGDFTGTEVHKDGEIYGAIGWLLWKTFETAGVGKDKLLDYIVGGMNYTPPGPAFENMRDGILQAAANSTAHQCLIWEAFAHYGVGVGAKATVKGGGPFGGGKVSVSESFTKPSQCSSVQQTVDAAIGAITVGTVPIYVGSATTVTVHVTNNGNSATGAFTVTLTDDGAPVGQQGVATLAAGASTNLAFNWTPSGTGSHTLVASHNLSDDNLANNTASQTVTVDPAPTPGTVTVSAISPNSMNVSQSPFSTTITGSGFGTNTDSVSVAFLNGSGPTPNAQVVSVTENSISVKVTASTKGKKGTVAWDVVVTTPNGSDTLVQSFFVTR